MTAGGRSPVEGSGQVCNSRPVPSLPSRRSGPVRHLWPRRSASGGSPLRVPAAARARSAGRRRQSRGLPVPPGRRNYQFVV